MMTHYSQSNTCLHLQDEICYTKYNEKKGPFRTGIGFGEQDASFRLLCLASVLFFCRRGSSSPTRRCSSRFCSAKCLLGCVDQVQEPILVLLFPECNSMLRLIFPSPNLMNSHLQSSEIGCDTGAKVVSLTRIKKACEISNCKI